MAAEHSLPFILPNGYLALCKCDDHDDEGLLLLDLGLQPAPLCPPPPPAPHPLAADLGALLERQPDATADVTVLAGGHAFPAHKTILAARSPVFRWRIEGGGFGDGSPAAQQLQLPEADPDAFAIVLRFLYTHDAGELPAGLLQAVAELADQLGVEALCRTAQVGGTVGTAAAACAAWLACISWCCARPGPLHAHARLLIPALHRISCWLVCARRAWWARCCGRSASWMRATARSRACWRGSRRGM